MSTTTVSGDASAAPGTHDGHGVAGVVPTYDLDLPGARLRKDTRSEPRFLNVAVWTNGVAYLTRSQVLGPYGPYRDVDTPVDWLSPLGGAAWVGVPSAEPTARVHWVRSSAMPVAIRAYWIDGMPSVADREDALRTWVQGLRVQDSGSSGYMLADPRMHRVAAAPGGDRRARARVWDLGGEEIVVFATENGTASGFTNLLSAGLAERVSVPGIGDVWLNDAKAGWQVRHGSTEFWVRASTTGGSTTSIERVLDHLRGPPSSWPLRFERSGSSFQGALPDGTLFEVAGLDEGYSPSLAVEGVSLPLLVRSTDGGWTPLGVTAALPTSRRAEVVEPVSWDGGVLRVSAPGWDITIRAHTGIGETRADRQRIVESIAVTVTRGVPVLTLSSALRFTEPHELPVELATNYGDLTVTAGCPDRLGTTVRGVCSADGSLFINVAQDSSISTESVTIQLQANG